MIDKTANEMIKHWMCHYIENGTVEDLPSNLCSLRDNDWFSLLKHPLVVEIISSNSTRVEECKDNYLVEYRQSELLAVAIASLQAFVQENFLGPKLDSCQYSDLPFYQYIHNESIIEMSQQISVDGEEINENVARPELLLISKTILEFLVNVQTTNEEVNPNLIQWWYLRYLYIHQQILEEHTETLYAAFLRCSEKLVGWTDTNVENQTMCRLEVVQGLLSYRRAWKAVEHLNLAKKLLSASLDVTAFMGKRTKWQEKALPQMALKITLDDEKSALIAGPIETHGTTVLPTLLRLDDEVRLEKITFESEEDNQTMQLPSIVQQLVLSILQYTLQSQPKDNLADEELTPYLTTLLYQSNGAWSTRISTLLLNISQESSHKRTVERSLKQCEEVTNLLSVADEATVFQRLSFAYSSYIRPRWVVQAQLGALMTSLGMIKTALDLYQQLRIWDKVISCYTILELRHKAAEVIKQELDKKPTVELYCLLGDATDDVECYAKAWEFSKQRSGRAQRHWGCYYFAKHDYAAAVPHLQRSLELNSLQETVWARLGYSGLMLEDWKLAADAYRRYTTIEPNGFECWNNLSKAYINLGDKPRAHKVLQEALKCNFSNWKVWENFMLVSVDTGNFEDAINAFNQLIELRGKHFDAQVLEIIAKSVAGDVPDADGNSTLRLTKKVLKLVGHLGVLQPNEAVVWEMAALLHRDEPLLDAQNLQKAYRCRTQTQSPWSKNPQTCLQVLQLCDQLCQTSLAAWNARSATNQASVVSQLSSARMSAQGCVRAASDEKWEECVELIGVLDGHATAIREILLKR